MIDNEYINEEFSVACEGCGTEGEAYKYEEDWILPDGWTGSLYEDTENQEQEEPELVQIDIHCEFCSINNLASE